jgi:hypothetical protein
MKAGLAFLIIVLLLAGTILADKKESTLPEPPLVPSEFNWLFGFIPRDAQVCHHYVLANIHADTVTIERIEPGCDCTHTPRPPVSIAPGESYDFQVLFDTRTYIGQTNRNIRIVTDYEPNPEMYLYFMSAVARAPKTITISPSSTAFIVGKEKQVFTIKNLEDEKTGFTIYIDNDSSLAVSETSFTLKGKAEKEIAVFPIWERVPEGPHYRCLVIEVVRKEAFRVAVPIKLNKF